MNKTISLTALVSDESSVVEAQGPTHNGIGTISAKGWAKKHPNDQPDEQVGFNVAVARALRSLADQYDKRAEQCMNNPPVTAYYYDQGWKPMPGVQSVTLDPSNYTTLEGRF